MVLEDHFRGHVRTQLPAVLDAINASGAMSDENEQALAAAMKSFKSSYSYQA